MEEAFYNISMYLYDKKILENMLKLLGMRRNLRFLLLKVALINKQTPLDSVLASISVNTFDVSFWSVFINTLFPADTIRKYRIVWYNFVQELLRKAIVRPTDQPE